MESFIVTTSGEVSFTFPANGSDFSLKELQDSVNGNIEIVPIRKNVGPLIFKEFDKEVFAIKLTDEYIMIVNSEGKIESKQFNYVATVLATASESISPGDWIAGDVLVCRSSMVK